MSTAFLALWNDYPASLTEEYEAWHTFEHVPERLTTPGMLSARRYAAFGQPHNRYFTLYDLQDLQVLDQPAYIELVRQPTEWSLSMRRHFVNVLRIPTVDVTSGGNGIGSSMIVQAYSVDRTEALASALALAQPLLSMISEGRILGFRLGIAEPNQPYEVFEQRDVTDPDTLNIVVLIEGTTRGMLVEAEPDVTGMATSLLTPRQSLRNGIFDLLVNYRSDRLPRDRNDIAATGTLRKRFDGATVSQQA